MGQLTAQWRPRALGAASLAFTIFLAAARAAAAQHVPLPPVNLGGSSFTDAVGGPGFFVRELVTVSHAPHFRGEDGSRILGDHSLTTFVGLTHVAFILPYRVLGGYWGADALVPLAHVAVSHDGRAASATGIGDLIVSPIVIQWPAVRIGSRPFFFHRLSLTMMLPTGLYGRPTKINVGSNVFSLNPSSAFTFLLTQRLETSWRVHYLWNSANAAPSAASGTERVQPGQAFHVNGAVSYVIIPEVRVGVAGYFLAQTTDSLIDGRSVPKSRERVAALGPGIRVSVGTFHFALNAFWELAVENRPSGFRVGVSVMNVWPFGEDA